MGVLADRLDSMRVRASSPDGKIIAELRNRTEVRLRFVRDSYHEYGEAELARQLAGLAKLLWAGRMREYYAAVSEAFGETVTGEGPPVSPCDVDYYTARQELVAVGVSGDGRIRLMVRGMRAWTVRVAAGTVRALSEQEFCAGAAEAARELIRDQFDKIRELKQRCYR